MKTVKIILFIIGSLFTSILTYLIYLTDLEQGVKVNGSLLFALIMGGLIEFLVIWIIYGMYIINNWNK